MLRTFIYPWEQEQLNQDPGHRGFFHEMFFKYYNTEVLDNDFEQVKFLT